MSPIECVQDMHPIDGFEDVLHVAHHEWHGIRSATSAMPGQKLLISADHKLEFDRTLPILNSIESLGIRKVIFQGYSHNADALLLAIKARFLTEVECFAVTHVTTTQFENLFEIDMIRTLQMRHRMGTLTRLGSVKPGFGEAIEPFFRQTIINFAPNIDPAMHVAKSQERSVHVPLDVNWRKNMYTNITAAVLCDNVDKVKTSNYPTGLADIINLNKVHLTGFLRGQRLLDEMGRSAAVLLVTLAECQPMTQLEAFAMGTPAMTLPLGLDEFEGDELMNLCSATASDNPAALSKNVKRLVDAATSESDAIQEMIRAHLEHRSKLARERLADFLGL